LFSSVYHEAIARRAYEIYLSRGAGDGLDLEDWLQAECELVKPERRGSTTKRRPAQRKTRR